MSKIILYTFSFALLLFHTVNAQDDNLKNLSKWFDGKYNTSEQAALNKQIIDITLQVKEFSIENQKGKWFYLETAFTINPESPYRQEIYHFHTEKFGIIYLDKYSLDKPDELLGATQHDSLLTNITLENLILKENCALVINTFEDAYIGASFGKGCESKIRGANYSTSDIEITKEDFFLWEKGFDLRDQQVWGPTDNGYVFKKLSENK